MTNFRTFKYFMQITREEKSSNYKNGQSLVAGYFLFVADLFSAFLLQSMLPMLPHIRPMGTLASQRH